MAKKQVLQIKDFSGGVNSYSDPRDLQENEFQILDNAVVDELGIIRVSGGLELKDNIDITGETHQEAFPSAGSGLFSYATDYYESSSDFNSYLEMWSQNSAIAWGITDNDGGTGGVWEFGAGATNTNNKGPGYFGIGGDGIAINYASYTALGSENHGSVLYNNIKISPGKSYTILLKVINENPWYYLGSNIPPRIRLYNSTLGKYLYPDGFSDTSDETHTALISTGEGNCTVNADFWNASSGATIARQVVDGNNPVGSSAAHKSYNSFFGSTDILDASDTGAAYLKVISSVSSGAFHTTGKYAYSDNITVVANTTYLFDCIYNTNGVTGTTSGVGMRILNKDDSDATIPFNNGSNTAPPSSEWVHFNAPIGGNIYASPTSLEFTTPNGCTNISILVGVDNDGTGADYAGFSGFNLRKKMYELNYIDEISDSFGSNLAFFKHPNSWANENGGTSLSSPYIPNIGDGLFRRNYNDAFRKARLYRLNFNAPINFDESIEWSFSLEAGIWGGINQGSSVNNFIVGYIEFFEISLLSGEGKGHNVIMQSKNTSNNSMSMSLYNYNPFDKLYNKLNYLSLPSGSNSVYNFTKGSKDVYMCDKTFYDKSLYSLKNNKSTNLLELKNVSFAGPSITYSSQGSSFVGTNTSDKFWVSSYYSAGGTNTHAGNTSTFNNTVYVNATSQIFYDEGTYQLGFADWMTGNAPIEGGSAGDVVSKMNQFSGELNVLEHDVATGTGSGLPSGLSGFKYDIDDSDWLDSTNPYTKYIVIKNDDIVGTDNINPGSLDTGKRISQVDLNIQHVVYAGHYQYTDFASHHSPNMKVYLDVITTGASDITASPPNVDGSEGGYSIPGDANFIATIGEVELNPMHEKLSSYTYTDHSSNAPAAAGWKIASWGDVSNDTHVARKYSIYSKEYNVTIHIPYTMTAGGSNITVHASSGTNLQLRFVPQINPLDDFWHKGPAFTDLFDGQNGTTYTRHFADGILSDYWTIGAYTGGGADLRAYLNNSADTEDSFAFASLSDLQLNVGFETPDEGEADGWDSDWRFYFTLVDNNNIESAIGSKSEVMINTDVTKCPKIDVVMDASNGLASSYKFMKAYATSSRNGNYNLQFIIDLKKGTIKSSTSDEEFYSSNFSNFVQYTLPSKKMLLPNEIDGYESETGVLIENALDPKKMIATFKTGVIANNTLYAGNVYQDGEHHPDRMLKSPIGKSPLLPSTNFIDVAINDGDDIVSLQFYKDRLLQFKKDKLFIISTSEDYEYLQDTVENVGIFQESQVTRTPYGIAWINERGCYLYDGTKVNNLTDGKIGYKSWKDSESTWEVKGKHGASIVYLKKDDKLIVYGATKKISDIALEEEGYGENFAGGQFEQISGKQYLRQLGYQYDFKTKSWINLTNFREQLNYGWIGIDDGNPRLPNRNDNISNFTYDENGDSIFVAKPSNLIMRWNDNPRKTTGDLDLDEMYGFPSDMTPNSIHRDFRIITKDYDFGAPSVKKKVYKIYVTFKSTHIESNKIKKVRQNQDEYSSSNVGVYYAINGTNNWNEFSETKSKNYGTKGLISADSETTTTLSSDVSSSATTISVTSTSNIKVGYVLIVGDSGAAGNERMLVLSISGTTITVDRNYSSYDSDPYTTWVEGAPFKHDSGDTVSISTGDWIVAELKASASINKIDSFKLKFETKKVSGASNEDNGVPPGFMINDISVIYRTKNVR